VDSSLSREQQADGIGPTAFLNVLDQPRLLSDLFSIVINPKEQAMAKISFNGKEYDSPEAMPAEVRQLYQMAIDMLADKNQDGIPDVFSGMAGGASVVQMNTSQFVVDGKAYASLDELPADARQRYEQAFGQFDANRNGIPDMLEGNPFGIAQPAPATAAQPTAAQDAGPGYQEPRVTVIGDTPSASRTMLLSVAGLVIIVVAIGAFYLLMR
jgi:hypothetical protein